MEYDSQSIITNQFLKVKTRERIANSLCPLKKLLTAFSDFEKELLQKEMSTYSSTGGLVILPVIHGHENYK